MSKGMDWQSYVNDMGDFELPRYLNKLISDLMKESLDLGTLLSEDPAKLRAYKEQIKSVFKGAWLEVAKALEFFDLVVPCGCKEKQYCKTCGGSRYIFNEGLSPDKMREFSLFLGPGTTNEVAEKLHKGLLKALNEIQASEYITSEFPV